MSFEEIMADALPRPAGHYSHAVRAGGLVFVSGLLPVGPDGRARADAPFDDQVAQVLANLDAVLAAAGTSRAALAQVRVYITDLARWARFNELYATWIGERRLGALRRTGPGPPPRRADRARGGGCDMRS